MDRESRNKVFWRGNNRAGFFQLQDRREQLDHAFGSGFKPTTEHRDQSFQLPRNWRKLMQSSAIPDPVKREFLENSLWFSQFQWLLRWIPDPSELESSATLPTGPIRRPVLIFWCLDWGFLLRAFAGTQSFTWILGLVSSLSHGQVEDFNARNTDSSTVSGWCVQCLSFVMHARQPQL